MFSAEATTSRSTPGGQGFVTVRSFLEDGDRVMLRGWCERDGYVRIGFGEAAATVLPAP